MRRFLTAVLLTFTALALAAPAQADRGDKWREWHGGRHHHDNDSDRGPPPDSGRPPDDPSQSNFPLPNDGAHEGRDSRENRGNDGPPWFGGHREHDRAREGVMRGRMMPLEDLEDRISRQTPGFRIGNPELLSFGGRPVYRIRWRTPDGHILIVFADAETGDVLDIRGR